ncbi:MAG: cyanophycin synthetase, partial [Bacteroidales bacterium]|nr:cyanophycin synthetase [Bacteroidales bacterium]
DDTMEGLNLRIDGKELWSILSGLFNAKNLLAVYGAARLEGFTADEILPLLSIIGGAEGRFQKIRNDKGVTAIVDYAHSPDALENILKAVTESRGDAKQVITVVGAGGNRDPYKRPKMASVAVFYSNQVILTSDNPRNEDAEKIIDDMERKLDPVEKRKVIRIANRKEAIKTACRMAHQGDIILVAGKGHEKYQEIGGVKHPFDDVEIVKEFLINND